MSDNYFPPEYLKSEFHCLRCGVYAKQNWSTLHADSTRYDTTGNFPVKMLDTEFQFNEEMPSLYVVSKCERCRDYVFWYKKQIIFPRTLKVPQANTDLTDEIKELYDEAANVLPDSSRAAAALLRLALQLLLKELGGAGKRIDTDIKTIVAGGVDPQVQKAMDIVRVFGNNAAHPGEIQLNEDSELVKKMFELINFIATKMITSKKEIDSLFDDLPESTRDAIVKRDKNSGTIA